MKLKHILCATAVLTLSSLSIAFNGGKEFELLSTRPKVRKLSLK